MQLLTVRLNDRLHLGGLRIAPVHQRPERVGLDSDSEGDALLDLFRLVFGE